MLFIDSSYLIALLIDNDKNNSRASVLANKISEKKLINNTVLSETLNSYINSGGKLTKELFSMINETYDIHYLSEKEYEKTIDTYLNYDSAINYNDCTILQSMKKFDINRIVSFDSNFDKIEWIKRIY
ncbi:MAG: type II toxin-antitoxin system VapC family toxin [Methanobacteriaceae archaeon]|jgi:hypothetical protein|nr:type II toxin-antitoxin system VapC family toxin [Methanobacteriaceae archaeon]